MTETKTNLTIKDTKKLDNGSVMATILFPDGTKVKDAVVVKDKDGNIFALAPQADGKYSYITWDRDDAAKAAAEAVLTNAMRALKTPQTTSIGDKIGFVDLELTTPVEIRVFVNKNKDGKAYITLPGRSYTTKDEAGNEKKGVSYYVYISRDDADALAAEALAMVEAE